MTFLRVSNFLVRQAFLSSSLGKSYRNSAGRVALSPSPQLRRQQQCQSAWNTSIRFFNSEAEYHPVADDTLNAIQDAVEEALESLSEVDEYEITNASGVLTMKLPPHGTWVINKQTPNRQLWWSSPLSGPKRYEYVDGEWISTKDGLVLGPVLVQELRRIYPTLEDFHIIVE